MARYVMICMRVIVMLCFFDSVHSVQGTHLYTTFKTARNYTWTTANASCSLLGSDLTGSLLANQVKINKGTIQSRGWIGAHVITNGTVQFTGCFFGSLNSEPGLIVTTDHILHCNYFCNASGFMFHKSICYCIKHTETLSNERCTGRFYHDASYIVYGTDIKRKQSCLCRYNHEGDKRGEHPNELCITEQNLNSTLNSCYGPPYFNSTGYEVMNKNLNLTRVTMDVNGTQITVWYITWAHRDTWYSAYWTGIVRQDIFVWGSYRKHSSNNVNAPLSCVGLIANIPIVTGNQTMSKGMLFPVKVACNGLYPGICVGLEKTTLTVQYPTASSKTINTVGQLSTSIYNTAVQLSTSKTNTAGKLSTSKTNTAGQLSSSKTNTAGQLSTSKTNTAGQLSTSKTNTAGQLSSSKTNTAGQLSTSKTNTAGQLSSPKTNTAGQLSTSKISTAGQLSTSKTNTEHRAPETSTERVYSNSMYIKTAEQTTIIRVKSELPLNSYPSPSDAPSIVYGYSSEVISTAGTYISNIWYHITSSQSFTPNINQPTIPVSGSSTGISSSLLGPVIGGAVSFVVIVIACVVLLVCLKTRRENENGHGTQQLNPFPRREPTDNVYINNPEFVRDDEDVLGVRTETVHQPLHNEQTYVNIQRTSTEHIEDCPDNFYHHTGAGNDFRKKTRGDNPIGPAHDLYDHSRINNVMSGGTYDSFRATEDNADDSVNNYDTAFGNVYGSLQKGGNTSGTVDDLYDHFRNNDRNTNNTYDSLQSTQDLENCLTDEYGTWYGADYGYLQKVDHCAQPVDDLYDHSRGHGPNTGDTYDTFQSSQGQGDVSDYYDHCPVGH